MLEDATHHERNFLFFLGVQQENDRVVNLVAQMKGR
jgi:hypothetical protein